MPPSRLTLHAVALLAISLLLVAALGAILIMVVIHSLVDRLLGARRQLQVVSDVALDRVPKSWRGEQPLYGCLVHRSTPLCQAFVERLQRHYSEVRMARWQSRTETFEYQRLPGAPAHGTDESVDGRAQARGPRPPLHVIDGFEQHLLDRPARHGLLDELERLLGTGSSLLILSQVLPAYWLARADQTLGDGMAAGAEEATAVTRWSHVLSPLDVRRLREDGQTLERHFAAEISGLRMHAVTASTAPVPTDLTSGDGPPSGSPLYRAMEGEAVAHPTLLRLAAAIARQTYQERCQPPRSAHPRHADGNEAAAVAYERFSVRAAGHFHKLWWASTREEQLQLLSLARRGYVDPAQSALLASLANRGLVTREGPVRLRSIAFGRFVARDLIHDGLLAWRDQTHGNTWRAIWPPLLVFVVLAVAFFVSSTPEALAPLAAVLAASVGALPVLGSLLRHVGELRRLGNGNQMNGE